MPPPSARRARTPWLGARIELGMAFGGQKPEQNSAVHYGAGISASLGALYLPLWLGRCGLGVSADFGVKYDATQTVAGSSEIVRYPLRLGLQGLIDVAERRWFVDLGVGPELDLGIKLMYGGTSSDDWPDHRLPAAFGVFATAGVVYFADPLGVAVALRYVGITYQDPSSRSADNLGLFFRLDYFF